MVRNIAPILRFLRYLAVKATVLALSALKLQYDMAYPKVCQHPFDLPSYAFHLAQFLVVHPYVR